MEWPKPNIRKGNSTLGNLHYAAPRKAEIAWLAEGGFRRNRLPILWEMLQPVLFDASPNAATRALVGEPGEFHALYAQQITDVLDAHAAAAPSASSTCTTTAATATTATGPTAACPGSSPARRHCSDRTPKIRTACRSASSRWRRAPR